MPQQQQQQLVIIEVVLLLIVLFTHALIAQQINPVKITQLGKPVVPSVCCSLLNL
jgi:hypothetical protein